MHYSVIVIGENVDDQLAPFNEELEVEQYLRQTKEEIIQEGKDRLKRDVEKGCYFEYSQDPEAYEAKYSSNPRHIKYVKEEIPKMMKWSDEDFYENGIRWYDEEDIDPTTGGILSTSNPQGKWDWYEIGGRWAGKIKLKKGAPYKEPNFSWGWPQEEKDKVLKERRVDSALKKDIANLKELTSYYLLMDGSFYGADDDFNYTSGEYEDLRKLEKEFEKFVQKTLKSLSPKTRITIVDIHN